jgi:hypothetical protein
VNDSGLFGISSGGWFFILYVCMMFVVAFVGTPLAERYVERRERERKAARRKKLLYDEQPEWECEL